MHIEAELRLPTDGRFVGPVRDSLTGFLEALNAPQSVVDDVQILVTEACANAVRHAAHTEGYRLVVEAHGDRCSLQINDRGPGFDEEAMSATVLEPAVSLDDLEDRSTAGPRVPDELVERGRGLFVINALADEVDLTSNPEGASIRVEKRWET